MNEGRPEPLGVTLDVDGVNVAVHAPDAELVELCLFDGDTERRVKLAARTAGVFHAHVPGIVAGQHYGLRAHGPWRPEAGFRFNAAKLLLDPYATAIDRPFRLVPSLFGQGPDDRIRDDTDSAKDMPRCIVEGPPDPTPVKRPGTPWSRTIIYELPVRGFTMRNPGVPAALRGTFAGLAHPAALNHLIALGITAAEILPPAAWIDDRQLPALGLSNAWGYNTAAFLAPDPRLAPGGWTEVRAAVSALADAGIETIVDIVLNHTGEGDELGPTLSLRGLDNAGYYRLRPDNPRFYVNDTGCGDTVALDRPPGLRLAMDSLRAWAVRGGVHGFRFDLAPVLGRRDDGFDPIAPLLQAIGQDPVLRELKMIAEPWDVGQGGYRLGQFPAAWGEWNDRFRDDTRKFWRGDSGMLRGMATRLAGSDDVMRAHGHPSRSINFVVAHDGFTLADLVSYERKHNDANGEGGRDGTSENLSWNNGAEGETADATIRAERIRDQIAMLDTLLSARGTPMLIMGSEGGHTQHGNNNAYCQDGLTWLDWDFDPAILAATRAAIARRQADPALDDDRFLANDGDVFWLRTDGTPMREPDWADGDTLIALFTTGVSRALIVLNRARSAITVTLPPGNWSGTGHVAARSVGVFTSEAV